MTQPVIDLVQRPAVRCAGMKIRTTMAKASQDCPMLWSEWFGPRMHAFPADPAHPDESYGVSAMLDPETFDYWAVMPLADGAEAPEGMEEITLPGGWYAHCALASLGDLGEAYTYIYSVWPGTQDKYAPDMQSVCLERYTGAFMKTGELEVLCPLVEK